MSFTVKDVITEALARSNLVPRRQPAPGDKIEDAFALLKGIAADYSRHNLLQFLRREVILPEACEPEHGLKPVTILGTIDPEVENDEVDAVVPNIAHISEVYLRVNANQMANTDVPLNFVSFEDFNNADFGIYIYTWQPITDTKVELKLKPRLLAMLTGGGRSVVITYNVAYSFDLDSTLRIPDVYKELFITALTYKLAVQFPRLTPEHTERLRLNMVDIENSLKTVSRANKLVIRDNATYGGLVTPEQLNSGSFIFPN